MTTTQAPKTMRGWAHTVSGAPAAVLKLVSDLPCPVAVGPSEVLVEISHAALNPGASIMIKLLPMFFRTKPSISDMDFAGTIVSAGADVPTSRDLRPGTKIFGSVPVGQYIGRGKGSLAEFVVVPESSVCETPEGLPQEQAAGLGIAGCSALVLLDAAKLKKGDKVLVHAASGGVGSLTVQLVKNFVSETGEVVATCSGANVEMVKGLGADEVIDYKSLSPVHHHLASTFGNDKFDAIIDCFGDQELFHNCAGYLKPGKPYIAVGVASSEKTVVALLKTVGQMMSNSLWPAMLGGVDRPYKCVVATANSNDMERLSAIIKDGKLKIPIDSNWEMRDGLKAYERILSGHARGKVIVTVKPSQR